MARKDNWSVYKSAWIAGTLFVALDLFLWSAIFSGSGAGTAEREYFFNAGQGDSELLALSHGVQVLIDAGSGDATEAELEKALPAGDRYLDLAIISSPNVDLFGGLANLLGHFRVGAIIYNGRGTYGAAWSGLMEKIRAKRIPLITLGARDSIHYASDAIEILSPDTQFVRSADLKETGLVLLSQFQAFSTLFTADIDTAAEDHILKTVSGTHADILKVADHGSATAASETFLRAAAPKVAIIETSAHRKGYPASSTISQLSAAGVARLLRTDADGTVVLAAFQGKLRIRPEK